MKLIIIIIPTNFDTNFGLITQRISSLFMPVKFLSHIDSTNDQNTMRRLILGYIYTLTIKIHIKKT